MAPMVVCSAKSCVDYFFGGLIMMCAPAVPGYISQGSLLDFVDRPVDSGVAYGTYTTHRRYDSVI